MPLSSRASFQNFEKFGKVAASASGMEESPSSWGSPKVSSRNGAILLTLWDEKVCCRSVLKYAERVSSSGAGNAQRWNTGYRYRYEERRKESGTRIKSALRSTETKNM